MEIDERGVIIKVIKRPPVDVEFYNLCCKVGKKEILKSICGKFSSGHLTGILGCSGAGKTTLLNTLAGDAQGIVSGRIYINGEPRVMRDFRKVSCYLRQEDLVQPYLTVLESVTIATQLKLGERFSDKEKQSLAHRILSTIGLDTSHNTAVEHLSGGERKRLTIALELVNNPAVIFLDEPTTGLDDVSLRQCVKLLKSLASQGRNIICTIHQPSDSIFKLFDMVYFLSDGYCIYNGTVPDLIPFLLSAGCSCPMNYNPADYIIESVNDQESRTLQLSNIINNGNPKSQFNSCIAFDDYGINDGIREKPSRARYSNEINSFETSFWTQFLILLRRNFIQLRRNKIVLALHFAHNFICGLCVGILFYQVGMRGSMMILNLKQLYGLVIYFMFTHAMAPILLYPPEVKLLEREYFNRWYSLKAYFTASTVTLIPIIVRPSFPHYFIYFIFYICYKVITTVIFVLLVYFMTGQPLESDRFAWFCTVCVLTAITSQGLGYTIGALFNPIRGACVGSALAIPLVLLGMQGIGDGDKLAPYMRCIMFISYPYHAYVGMAVSVFKDRGRIDCDDVFCYFGDSEFLLLKMGMEGKSRIIQAIILLLFFVINRFLLYLFLRIRLSSGCYLLRRMELFNLS
ncbi:ABC transporter ATP-binding protein [Oryctes borbonicus]|uniref:ABC transporter ATP-binding protein n=1 Tax=Oryctes borbonicus TaxID=1629725 RepID=A0A0T6B6J4_9SCAR|nr:ABC transporter ATP-binding protein [Oryctes borbonicus]